MASGWRPHGASPHHVQHICCRLLGLIPAGQNMTRPEGKSGVCWSDSHARIHHALALCRLLSPLAKAQACSRSPRCTGRQSLAQAAEDSAAVQAMKFMAHEDMLIHSMQQRLVALTIAGPASVPRRMVQLFALLAQVIPAGWVPTPPGCR